MGSPLTDTRLTMMATLLFIAFENMQGNYHASGSLIRSGIKILSSTSLGSCIDAALLHDTLALPRSEAAPAGGARSLSATPSGSSRVSRPPSPAVSATSNPSPQPSQNPDDEVAEMTQMFARLSTVSAYLPFPHCKFAYHMLLDPRLTDPLANPQISSFPMTLDQARASWDFYLPVLGNFFQKTMWHNLNHAYEFDLFDAAREQGEHLAWLRKFGSVLEMLSMNEVERQRAAPGAGAHRSSKMHDVGAHQMNRGVELLTIQHLVATIFTTCCLDSTEMLYDAFTPQFSEILSRCQAFIADVSDEESQARTLPTGFKLGFNNDAGLLPLLGFVTSKCRNRSIRLDALSLIGRWDCREGSWDSRTLTNGTAALIGLEELGMDVLTGQIPAQARFVWTNCSWDTEHKSMSMQFTRVLPNESGEYERKDMIAGL